MPKENLVGQKIADYSIEELVGEGGTSVVYRAVHPQHGTVAFKALRDKMRQDKTALARFTREANFGKRVLHPNVIKTIETGQVEGIPYLVIEWAGGDLLESYAKKNAPMPREEVANVILQISDAVGAAHTSGIVHRDLKPDNAMYDHATGTLKLLDFGIAAATDTSQDERLTRAGYFVGTLMYVAPEALSGALVTPAADQYSLATISYLLLTGTLPYLAKSPREMFTQLLVAAADRPEQGATRPGVRSEGRKRGDERSLEGTGRSVSRRADVCARTSRRIDGAPGDCVSQEPRLRPQQRQPSAPDDGLLSRMKGLFRRG